MAGEMRFAVFGAGFWPRYQLAAWNEVGGVRCVAVCDWDRARAEALAREFGIPAVYDDPEALFQDESARLGFIDNITQVEGHKPITLLAARYRVPAICQKPLAETLEDAEQMADACRTAGVPLLVHENWRWQTPIRAAKRVIQAGTLGQVFRARLEMVTRFAVWENQPALARLQQFILTDIGTHVLDAARFLFGEADRLYCQTHRTLPAEVAAENVATVQLSMNGGQITVVCSMAYARTPVERECFPQTLLFVEGTAGSLEIAPNYDLRVTTSDGTRAERVAPPRYEWANPDYDVVHASLVPCLRDLKDGLTGAKTAETTAEDNLRTLRLVFAAYESAETGQAVRL
jgi:predicted dehydrogenase